MASPSHWNAGISIRCIAAIIALMPLWAAYAQTPTTPPPSLFLEDLTSPEVQAALNNGYDTALIATGGVEQNGAHMVLGKHNIIMRYAAQAIAQKHGNMLIAPIITYVPEGDYATREGHMNYAGTISLREKTFLMLLEDTLHSLQTHGFKRLYLVGDSGGNQKGMQQVAKRLHRPECPVIYVPSYYDIASYSGVLEQFGVSPDELGHAGIIDTSSLLAINPQAVRADQMGVAHSGLGGNPKRANADLGAAINRARINAAIAFMRQQEQTKQR